MDNPAFREYSPAEFADDCAAAGLTAVHRFGGYALEPCDPDGDYLVSVLAAGGG